jgi:hypothetical protein
MKAGTVYLNQNITSLCHDNEDIEFLARLLVVVISFI